MGKRIWLHTWECTRTHTCIHTTHTRHTFWLEVLLESLQRESKPSTHENLANSKHKRELTVCECEGVWGRERREEEILVCVGPPKQPTKRGRAIPSKVDVTNGRGQDTWPTCRSGGRERGAQSHVYNKRKEYTIWVSGGKHDDEKFCTEDLSIWELDPLCFFLSFNFF